MSDIVEKRWGRAWRITEKEHQALLTEIERLRASELAWRLIAKGNDKWNALPQTEKEASLAKALEDEIAEGVRKEAEIERLRELNAKLTELIKQNAPWLLATNAEAKP